MTAWRIAVALCWLVAATTVRSENIDPIALEGSDPVKLADKVRILEDPEGQLSPFEVLSDGQSDRWRAAEAEALKRNYSGGVFWLLFELDASRSIHKEWDLVLANPFLHYIDLYQLFELSGPRLVHRTGSARPFSSRQEEHRFFILPLEIYGPTTYLMRVDSTAFSSLPMTLYPSQDFWATLQLGDIGNWLFYGVILSMVTYNLFLYLTVRDSSYLWYVLFIGCFGMLQFSLDGYLYQYLWWPDQGYDHRINFWLTTLALGFAGCFIFKFLDLCRVSPVLSTVLLTAVGAQLALALLAFVLDGRTMGRLLTLNGIVFMNLALLVGLYAWLKGLVAAKFFVLAWALFYLGNMLFLVNGAGWFELPWSPILASKLGSFFETMLLSFALAYRIRVLREEGERDRLRGRSPELLSGPDQSRNPDAAEWRSGHDRGACRHASGSGTAWLCRHHSGVGRGPC